MIQKSIFITGVSRGLGLGLTKHYLELGHKVFGTTRKITSALPESKNLTVFEIDLLDQVATANLPSHLKEHTDHLDIVINNAGRFGEDFSIDETPNLDDILLTLKTNVLAPLQVSSTLLPFLKHGADKKLVIITSLMGSISENSSGGHYGYRMSKAAVNMMIKNIAIDTKSDGITSCALHPGWVKTDMGGPNAPLEISESVTGMIRVIENLSLANTGVFIDYAGQKIKF